MKTPLQCFESHRMLSTCGLAVLLNAEIGYGRRPLTNSIQLQAHARGSYGAFLRSN